MNTNETPMNVQSPTPAAVPPATPAVKPPPPPTPIVAVNVVPAAAPAAIKPTKTGKKSKKGVAATK